MFRFRPGPRVISRNHRGWPFGPRSSTSFPGPSKCGSSSGTRQIIRRLDVLLPITMCTRALFDPTSPHSWSSSHTNKLGRPPSLVPATAATRFMIPGCPSERLISVSYTSA
jgi:hypothetical protein